MRLLFHYSQITLICSDLDISFCSSEFHSSMFNSIPSLISLIP